MKVDPPTARARRIVAQAAGNLPGFAFELVIDHCSSALNIEMLRNKHICHVERKCLINDLAFRHRTRSSEICQPAIVKLTLYIKTFIFHTRIKGEDTIARFLYGHSRRKSPGLIKVHAIGKT